MKDGPLVSIEREVLGWSGVFKKRYEDGPGGLVVTGYRYGELQTGGPQIGHVTMTATRTSGCRGRFGTS